MNVHNLILPNPHPLFYGFLFALMLTACIRRRIDRIEMTEGEVFGWLAAPLFLLGVFLILPANITAQLASQVFTTPAELGNELTFVAVCFYIAIGLGMFLAWPLKVAETRLLPNLYG